MKEQEHNTHACKMTVLNKQLFFPLLFFSKRFKFRVFYKTLNYFCALFFSLRVFLHLRADEKHITTERERERERDGWCVYSSQQRWQNDSDDEHFYDDQEKGEQEEELARRRLGGAKKEIESKENG